MVQGSTNVLAVSALLFMQGFVVADLRMGSSPKRNFVVKNENNAIPFTTTKALYMEPSTFGYQGLRNQKNNNYDNFLRSNIDNEQDNRNFNNEPGKDMLPFRTLEASSTGEAMTMTVGQEVTIPLRWNNPHSSECEVNVWIKNNEVVVPIKKPVCCGEGYQDAVITATIPANFNDLIAKVPGFEGCNKVGDCTLQIYGHSVEPRTYAIGVPLIVKSTQDLSAIPKATNSVAIEPAAGDPGMNFANVLTLETCRPAYATDANLQSADPRYPYLASDVYNHAFQNSDYSPYSGQQFDRISKNLQAAVIIEMLPGNRGELGKSIFPQELKNLASDLRGEVNRLVRRYESIANNIFNTVGNQIKYNLDTAGNQKLASCFRCADVSSVNTKRLTTTTYIPSFPIPADIAVKVQNKIESKYKKIVNTTTNTVGIYQAVLADMSDRFAYAQSKGLNYLPAMVKTSVATMSEVSFVKRDAKGNIDGGKYAATKAAEFAAGKVSPANIEVRTETDVTVNDAVYSIGAVFTDSELASISEYSPLPDNPDDTNDVYSETADSTSSSSAKLMVSFVVALPAIAALTFLSF